MGRGRVSIANCPWYFAGVHRVFRCRRVSSRWFIAQRLGSWIHAVFRKSVGEEMLLAVGGGARGGLFMKDAPKLSSPSRGGLARFETAAV